MFIVNDVEEKTAVFNTHYKIMSDLPGYDLIGSCVF